MIIFSLSILIGIIGLLILLFLFLRLLSVESDLKLSKFRKKEAGLADLLNYSAVIDNGVIVCKNGAFMAAWLYEGKDIASSTEIERNDISFKINQALSKLTSGWMIHVDAVRHHAPVYPDESLSNFPDEITRAIDKERRLLFEKLGSLYEGYFILTVTWLPPLSVQQKIVDLVFDDDNEAIGTKDQTKNLINYFNEQIEILQNKLSTVFNLTRLKGHKHELINGKTITYDDFLSWLQFCITGIRQPIILPSNPMYLDAYIGGQELWTGVVPKIGNKFIQVIAIEGFPLESYPNILSMLGELPLEYRWSSRFIFMDKHQAVNELDKFRKKWKQKVRGFFDQVFNTNTGSIDQDALAMVQDAEDAMAEVNSNFVAMGYYTSVIIIMNEDRSILEASAKAVEKAILANGFAARIETVNTVEAYLGSLPGHSYENIRRPLINTLNLADFLPTSSLWTGENSAPCPLYPKNSPSLIYCVTSGSTPFRLNLHVGDVGHTLILGPTGSGKSTLLALIAAQLKRYKDMSLFVFDKGMSMYALTKATNGQHFYLDSDASSLNFSPLQFLDNSSDIGWAIDWIETILQLNNIEVNSTIHNEIERAIKSMQKSHIRDLSAFKTTIQNSLIRETLEQYTITGSKGHLLDAKEDNLNISTFMTFEIEELMNMPDKFAIPVLLYLFRRIERSLKSQPSAIILDEAWLMLSSPIFREKIREWLKVLRKANCIVILATQSLSDVSNSPIFDVIVESTASKIFLPNIYALNPETKQLYQNMGLNSQQIEIITQAIPKREYYYVSSIGHRLFSLALGDFTLAFVAASDKASIAKIKKLEAEYGDQWIIPWLEYKKINYSTLLDIETNERI